MPKISRFIRKLVFDRDENKCLCCGSTQNLTIDHIIPKSKGGKSVPDNYQTLCSACNGLRGNKTTTDYRRNKPEWWLQILKYQNQSHD